MKQQAKINTLNLFIWDKIKKRFDCSYNNIVRQRDLKFYISVTYKIPRPTLNQLLKEMHKNKLIKILNKQTIQILNTRDSDNSKSIIIKNKNQIKLAKELEISQQAVSKLLKD